MSHQNFTEYFGCNVFNDAVMQERLPKDVYKRLRKTIDEGKVLDEAIADVVANAMMQWAMEHGATHYTHWFQPLTGITAEKHDSFIVNMPNNRAICEFSGKALIKGEPDASSFPSGGLRATFEARGYTAWDCTSPAFLKEDKSGVTLCIPTAFCAYTGVALDKKTPLLRSVEALNTQALRVLKCMGKSAKRVDASVGAEQEYFLVDRDLCAKRLDLAFTGRTLFGNMPPKGQEMDDHYFGTLKERVAQFMKEVDEELWKLGVYAKTKHNEAAPAQHELAPIYDNVNLATDHNQLVMETMRRVAKRHNFSCLLHEKPFRGVNGSGKHNNWSIVTDKGENLLNPGKNPQENLIFLVFCCAVIQAVDEHAALLRASAANAGNDHRLGGNEAPPAIISMYFGDPITNLLKNIAKNCDSETGMQERLDMGVATLPDLLLDDADRNRTSPFAFTGNKFEFRMVGSSASIAGPNTVLNSIVADSLSKIADRMEKMADVKKETPSLLAEIIREHGRVIFNGNSYSKEWEEEAERRGLPNVKNSVDAYAAYIAPEVIELFERLGVYTEQELKARYDIKLEKYVKVINIEAKAMLQMAKREILPVCIDYATTLADATIKLSAAPVQVPYGATGQLLEKVASGVEALSKGIETLSEATEEMNRMSRENILDCARVCRDRICPAMEGLREAADALEAVVDKKLWPMPTYDMLLFGE